jgi:hypothetical protein
MANKVDAIILRNVDGRDVAFLSGMWVGPPTGGGTVHVSDVGPVWKNATNYTATVSLRSASIAGGGGGIATDDITIDFPGGLPGKPRININIATWGGHEGTNVLRAGWTVVIEGQIQ